MARKINTPDSDSDSMDEFEEDLINEDGDGDTNDVTPHTRVSMNMKARRELERRREEQKLENLISEWNYF